MKTLQITRYGGAEVLAVADVPTPEPGRGEVRVCVEAAAVQIADAALRAGRLADVMPDPTLPTTPGWEFAGTVDAVGDAVGDTTGHNATGWRHGQAVVGLTRHFDTNVGAQAEYLVVPAGNLALAPRSATAVESSTLPIALTAVQALDLLGVTAGTTLVVTGAVGAVGGYATQLAALRGATVIASASPADADALVALGAAHAIDRYGDLAAQTRRLVPGGADALLNAANVLGALAAVRDGGRLVAVLLPPPDAERGIDVQVVFVQADGAQLAGLARLVDDGRLRLRVAGTYPLDRAADAHRRVETGGLRGRLVLLP